MNPVTFFYYRHKTDKTVSTVELFGLGETINKSFHENIKAGDIFRFEDLKEADKVALRKFTKYFPQTMVVKEVTIESNQEIRDGIRKIYLE